MVQRLAPDVVERNYAKEALTRAEIGRILDAAASIGDVLNTRHATAKAQGWRERLPSRAAFVKAASAENNLLRRPILVTDGGLAVGADPAAIRKLLRP
ncbi:MAG: hypothetical protein O2894_12095 [Planctomycetota bacterium]|nr:hypothetical protein [Planctomycetota bacterium]